MQDTITLRGRVATDPTSRKTPNGKTVVGFRLACTERRYDRVTGQWADAHTNWYSVSAFGQLGTHARQSLAKGNPVIVTGRLRVRDWATDERSGTNVDVLADALGHDLNYGMALYQKALREPRGAGQDWGQSVDTGALRSLVDDEGPDGASGPYGPEAAPSGGDEASTIGAEEAEAPEREPEPAYA